MEEKKLTDEEIVKAIDKCFAIPMKCEDGCPYFNKNGRNFCVEDKRFYHDLKDLIHRLQADNIQLKAIVSGLEDEKKVESIIFGLKETIAEQKAEIERLTDTLNQYINGELINADTMGKIIYLEKQVDDLTAKNEHLDSENTRLICEMDKMLDEGWDIMDEEADGWYKKGCKDTAKEICELLEKWAWKLKNEKGGLGKFRFAVETVMQEIKEKYLLEVANFKLVELKKGEKK